MSSQDAPGGREKLPLPSKEPVGPAYGADVEASASQLMSATKHGDRAAFDQLTQTLRSRAYLLACSLVGSKEDALELTQEAFLKTYRARATYTDGSPFLPWFHRILKNTCFSHLRKEKRLRAHTLSPASGEGEPDWEIEGDEPAPDADLASDEATQAFWRGFRRLSARDREILTLRHFQELSYRDIARALAIPEGTVMSRLFHARARLREHLAGHFGEERTVEKEGQRT